MVYIVNLFIFAPCPGHNGLNTCFLQEDGLGRKRSIDIKNETTMEENNGLTPERSLEIIKEQIERSRKSVSKDVGKSLIIASLCIIGVAIVASVCLVLFHKSFDLLYLLVPVLIIGTYRYVNRNNPKVPANPLASMVDKTWLTFGIFAISIYLLSVLFNKMQLHSALATDNMQVYFQNRINPVQIILLMMGMSVTVNGFILKNRWMVWCGIIGGIGGFFWESFCLTETLMANHGIAGFITSCLVMVAYIFISLTLPGRMLLKQNK